ncbi:chaperone modulator CbpM [Fundidesulfovibrio butyratiphilus]
MDITILYGSDLPAKSDYLAWSQFLEFTGMHPSLVGELIELGWLSPRRTTGENYLFSPRDVYRARKLARLSADLEISAAGASIIVDLLERITQLEKRIRHLERLV